MKKKFQITVSAQAINNFEIIRSKIISRRI